MARDPSRTEQPSGRRLNKAREKGNLPKSAHLGKAMVLLAGVIGLRIGIGNIGTEMMGLFAWFFHDGIMTPVNEVNAQHLLMMTSLKLAKMLLPVLVFIAVVAYITFRLQVGKVWRLKFNFDLSRYVNILGQLKNTIFNYQSLIRLGRSLLEAAAIALAPYLVLKKEWDNLLPLFYQNADAIAAYMLSTGYRMLLYCLVPIILIAVADLFYTRWKYIEDLKMTKDEVKDERKQAEGDPVIRMAQKKKMFSMMQKRMMEQVPKADVVITNPTHFAVALRYNALEAPAPIVLAKGADFLAQKIKEIARENNIPIRENRPLAQALYKSVEVGEAIPEDLYQAVATILAEIYRIKGKKR